MFWVNLKYHVRIQKCLQKQRKINNANNSLSNHSTTYLFMQDLFRKDDVDKAFFFFTQFAT